MTGKYHGATPRIAGWRRTSQLRGAAFSRMVRCRKDNGFRWAESLRCSAPDFYVTSIKSRAPDGSLAPRAEFDARRLVKVRSGSISVRGLLVAHGMSASGRNGDMM
jgi:hypothetical protein